MRQREDVVTAIIEANGGDLVGKVRLQKVVYLLEQLGLKSGFNFEYHYYGPFSRDLENATEDAKAFGLIREEAKYRNSDLASYSVFEKISNKPAKDEFYGGLGAAASRQLMKKFSKVDATVLELAATAHWLWRYEGRKTDWKDEITTRKKSKIKNGKLEKALDLLSTLELPPAFTG